MLYFSSRPDLTRLSASLFLYAAQIIYDTTISDIVQDRLPGEAVLFICRKGLRRFRIRPHQPGAATRARPPRLRMPATTRARPPGSRMPGPARALPPDCPCRASPGRGPSAPFTSFSLRISREGSQRQSTRSPEARLHEPLVCVATGALRFVREEGKVANAMPAKTKAIPRKWYQ